MRVVGINGIRSDGADNTDAMLARLQQLGIETCDAWYPMVRYIIQARSYSRQIRDARLLINRYHQDGDHAVCHSRGCLEQLRMMELGATFGTVFWFRPAMNRDFIIPKGGCERLFVIHSPDDRAIWLGEQLWFHDFGAAGRFGLYAGDQHHELYDERVTNIIAPAYEHHERWHHSDDFLPENIGQWVEFIVEHLGATTSVPFPLVAESENG